MANNLNPVIGHSNLLTGVAKRVSADSFNALKLAPAMPVQYKQGTYAVYGQENKRADGDKRAIGTEAKEIFSSKTTATYTCEWHSKKHPVDWNTEDGHQINNLQEQKMDAAQLVREQMYLEREKEIATLATTLTSYTSGSTTNYANAGTQWDTSSTSVMLDIAKGILAIKNGCGKLPNRIFIPAVVQAYMATQDPFKSMLQYGTMPSSAFGELGIGKTMPQFNLEIVTLHANYDSAGLGGSTVTLTDVWSDNVILAYVNPGWKNKDVTFMSTMTFEVGKTRGLDFSVWEYDENKKQRTWIEGNEWRDVIVVHELCGYLIQNTLAAV